MEEFVFLFCGVIIFVMFGLVYAYTANWTHWTQLGEKKPLSKEEVEALADGCIMDVNPNDPLLAEYIEAREKMPRFEFKAWVEENMGNLHLNLAVLAEAKLDGVFDDVLLNKKGECWELEKLLISINTKGESNCLCLLDLNFINLIHCGGDLSNNVYNVIIRDSRFEKVRERVESTLDCVDHRYSPYQKQWMELKRMFSRQAP